MAAIRIGILGSGKGSNCRAILERIRDGSLGAEARLVISDVADAGILEIAREFAVPNEYLPPGRFRTVLEPDAEIALVAETSGSRGRAGCSGRFHADV